VDFVLFQYVGEMSAKAPRGWQRLYNKVVEMRRVVTTPVDVIGCDKLADPAADAETQRFHTLVALMLSAQTRDFSTAEAMVNLRQSPKGLTAQSINQMHEAELNEKIRMVGMHNNKARYLKATAKMIIDEHMGRVPTQLEDILKLQGVGPKMAHLFLQCADRQLTTGIGVDVHVHRITQRFRWVPASVKTPEDTRKALESWLPKKHWSEINEILVGFGQTICLPRNPRCDLCAANTLCPSAFKECKVLKVPSRRNSALTRTQVDLAPAGANAQQLLDLCGGSSEALLEKGWLPAALPPVAIPENLRREQERLESELDSRPMKAWRREGSSVAASAGALSRQSSWHLADIEDAIPDDVTAPEAVKSGAKSKYFK
jgi:endonuclease-3